MLFFKEKSQKILKNVTKFNKTPIYFQKNLKSRTFLGGLINPSIDIVFVLCIWKMIQPLNINVHVQFTYRNVRFKTEDNSGSFSSRSYWFSIIHYIPGLMQWWTQGMFEKSLYVEARFLFSSLLLVRIVGPLEKFSFILTMVPKFIQKLWSTAFV